MKTFQITRKDMADLLLFIRDYQQKKTPLARLQEISFSNKLPSIFAKLNKLKGGKIGFSINEIVSLGNQIEFSSLSPSAVQNWVKRDVKEFIGSPQLGKKYTVEQTATLFIVEDLKASLDFDSIRKLLTLVFNNPADPLDDVVDPLFLYNAYASIVESINQFMLRSNTQIDLSASSQIEVFVRQEAEQIVSSLSCLTEEQQATVKNIIIISTLAVQTAYYQHLAKKYLASTLYLQDN